MSVTIENLTTATPVEIDTVLAGLWQDYYRAQDARDMEWTRVFSRAERALGLGGWKQRTPSEAEVAEIVREAVEEWEGTDISALPIEERMKAKEMVDLAAAARRYDDAAAAVDEAMLVMQPYDEEYVRRGRWTRAYLVTNSNGHVHSSMRCSTCFVTTRYQWMVSYSGSTEAEIVEAAGERACTVCYPSAPAEALARPTQMFTEDEEAKAKAREEREAKRAERESAKVTLTVYAQNWRTKEVAPARVTWKTVRALQNDTGALIRDLTGTYAMLNGFRLETTTYNGVGRVPVNTDEAKHNIKVMLAALAERGVDAEAVLAKNHKRAVKEGGTNWDGVLDD